MKFSLTIPSVVALITLSTTLYAQGPSINTTGLYGGTDLEIAIRGDHPNSAAMLIVGRAGVKQNPLINGLQLVKAQTFIAGTLDANGKWNFTVSLPPIAYAGKTFAMQVFTQNPDGLYDASKRTALIGEATDNARWSDITGGIPFTGAMGGTTHAEAIDFDNDGDMDLCISNSGSIMSPGGITLYMNDNGSMVDASFFAFLSGNTDPVFTTSWCDYDRDGDLDFVAGGGYDSASAANYPSYIYMNMGGVFMQGPQVVSSLDGANSFNWSDVDRDGDADLIISQGGQHSASSGIRSLALLINNNGVFTEDSTFNNAAFNNSVDSSTCVKTGDVDGDGDSDIYVTRTASATGAKNMLLLNDGNGVFTDGSAQLPDMFDKSSDAEFFDADNDGDLDIMVANSHLSVPPADSADLLINDGLGNFTDSPGNFPDTLDPNLGIRLGITTGDVDLDGDIDIIVEPHEFFGTTSFPPFVGHPELFLNQGGAQGGATGQFVKDSSFWAPGMLATFICYNGILFDADGDLDLDYYAPSFGGIVDPSNLQDRLLRNTLR